MTVSSPFDIDYKTRTTPLQLKQIYPVQRNKERAADARAINSSIFTLFFYSLKFSYSCSLLLLEAIIVYLEMRILQEGAGRSGVRMSAWAK
jgi:hypothetical protein